MAILDNSPELSASEAVDSCRQFWGKFCGQDNTYDLKNKTVTIHTDSRMNLAQVLNDRTVTEQLEDFSQNIFHPQDKEVLTEFVSEDKQGSTETNYYSLLAHHSGLLDQGIRLPAGDHLLYQAIPESLSARAAGSHVPGLRQPEDIKMVLLLINPGIHPGLAQQLENDANSRIARAFLSQQRRLSYLYATHLESDQVDYQLEWESAAELYPNDIVTDPTNPEKIQARWLQTLGIQPHNVLRLELFPYRYINLMQVPELASRMHQNGVYLPSQIQVMQVLRALLADDNKRMYVGHGLYRWLQFARLALEPELVEKLKRNLYATSSKRPWSSMGELTVAYNG